MPIRAAVAALPLLILTACGQTVEGSPHAQRSDATSTAAGADCTAVDAPLLDVETKFDSEPRVRIPQPEGWERFTDMDSKMIRGALVNRSLTAGGFTPNAVFTLDEIPGEIDPQQALDGERDNLVKLGHPTDLAVAPATVCGLPGQTVNYRMLVPGSDEPHTVVLREAVTHSGGKTYVVSLSIQTTRPDNPTYQRDSTTILDGLQVLTPAG